MHPLPLTADQLTASLLRISENTPVCILDSCDVGSATSNLLIAGIGPKTTDEFSFDDPGETLIRLDQHTGRGDAVIFTLSYGFGSRLNGLVPRRSSAERDLFAAAFDCLIIHDHSRGDSYLSGDPKSFRAVERQLIDNAGAASIDAGPSAVSGPAASNFSRAAYIDAVEQVRELIRAGETYQVNLTQQLRVELGPKLTPQDIFSRLRRDHPAPFAAFITRADSTVISASPERFLRVEGDLITASPIKGTRPRGSTPDEDLALARELLTSQKDRAENTMIVDLMRNDLGRICEYGSVRVEKLCELETHPTLFHLVSTVAGKPVPDTRLSDILRAAFPCGSITGAPKKRTMEIIDRIEDTDRGLSMGAIGCFLPGQMFPGRGPVIDLSVAIRTMVVRDNAAIFNVGGGIVTDSDAEAEYEESMLKARALLNALGSLPA